MFVAGRGARPRCCQVSDGQVGGPPGKGRYETKHWPDELIETSLQREREKKKNRYWQVESHNITVQWI